MFIYDATFSIVARCSRTGQLGVAVATASPSVRDRVPHAKARVGAIATQAYTNPMLGIDGIRLLERGLSPQEVLKALLPRDPGRERRQLIIVDKQGNTAAYTGRGAIGWKGHLIGDGFIVAGNMLAGEGVLDRMAHCFEGSAGGELAERLILTLEAGQRAGGDKRGRQSAALIVVSKGEHIDLRVDSHVNPVAELRRILIVSKT